MKQTRRNLGGITISGASTSAASMNRRTGVADTHRIRVENGRMVYWDEVIKSVSNAYSDLCRRKPSKYSMYYV